MGTTEEQSYCPPGFVPRLFPFWWEQLGELTRERLLAACCFARERLLAACSFARERLLAACSFARERLLASQIRSRALVNRRLRALVSGAVGSSRAELPAATGACERLQAELPAALARSCPQLPALAADPRASYRRLVFLGCSLFYTSGAA